MDVLLYVQYIVQYSTARQSRVKPGLDRVFVTRRSRAVHEETKDREVEVDGCSLILYSQYSQYSITQTNIELGLKT